MSAPANFIYCETDNRLALKPATCSGTDPAAATLAPPEGGRMNHSLYDFIVIIFTCFSSNVVFLFQLIRCFEVRPDPTGTEVKPITRTLLCPAKPINLQFLERRSEQTPRPAARASLWGALVFGWCLRPVTLALVWRGLDEMQQETTAAAGSFKTVNS